MPSIFSISYIVWYDKGTCWWVGQKVGLPSGRTLGTYTLLLVGEEAKRKHHKSDGKEQPMMVPSEYYQFDHYVQLS